MNSFGIRERERERERERDRERESVSNDLEEFEEVSQFVRLLDSVD